MNIEDHFFTRARLGRYWSEASAAACIAFFASTSKDGRYIFNPATEARFRASRPTDYTEHLLAQLP